MKQDDTPVVVSSDDRGDTWRAYQVAEEVKKNLIEIERQYRRSERTSASKDGVLIGMIIFLILKIWGVV